MKNNERGAGALALIAVLLTVFIGALFVMMMMGGASATTATGNDPIDDPTMMEQTYDVGSTDCLFFSQNSKVKRLLATDNGFPSRLAYYSKGLGYTANSMMAMFNIECGFNFNVVNPFGCGGMFQLCPPEVGGPATAAVGIRPRQLAALPPSAQLPYMYRYFTAMGCHRDPPAAKTPTHAYLCVFLPGYRNVNPSKRIWPRGNNPLHDVDNDGWIYKWEVDCNMNTSYSIGAQSCGLKLPRCSQSKVR